MSAFFAIPVARRWQTVTGRCQSAESAMSRAMRELQRDYQYAAEEAAGDAYDREMSRWYVP